MGPLVTFVVVMVSDVGLDEVLDAKRFALCVIAGLESHRTWRVGWELESERKSVGPEFLQKLFLDGRQLLLLSGRRYQLTWEGKLII